jgi:hypothetical protein
MGLNATHVRGAFGCLQRLRIQGIPALVTPQWALDAGTHGALWEAKHEDSVEAAMTRARARLAVVDLPAGMAKTDGLPRIGHFQERHTRKAQLGAALPSNRRKQVRRALRAGFTFEEDGMDLDRLITLHQGARERKAIPSDGLALHRLIGQLLKTAGARMHFVQDASGQRIAGGVFLHTQPGTVLYAFGGAERSEKSGLATVLLLAQSMECAGAQGAAEFDFGGSQDPGVDRFYAEFGGERVTKWRYVRSAPGWTWWWKWRRPDLFSAPA